MAVPKRRQSKARRDLRRSNWARQAQKTPAINYCKSCNAPIRPHRVCMECGHYGEQKVFEPTTTETEAAAE